MTHGSKKPRSAASGARQVEARRIASSGRPGSRAPAVTSAPIRGASSLRRVSAASGDGVVKVLRLKEGVDYDIRINGTGTGTMNYKINFMDENGEYTDFREFENIRITPQTRIDTTAKISDSTVLNVDSDNDGTYDLTYVAKENSKATVSKRTPVQGSPIGVIFIIVASVSVLLIAAILVFKIRREKRG